MGTDSAVGLIAYPAPDGDWAREVAATVTGTVVLVVSDPPDSLSAPYADVILESDERLGFGASRRLSMVLAGEFGLDCVVTDGDGQYEAAEIGRIQERLSATEADVIVPQRTSRTIGMRRDGEVVDRDGFETLETLCAGRAAGVDVSPSFDSQPGGFGFRRRTLPGILPEGDWLADWEITVSVLEGYSFETIDVATNEASQAETSFTWEDQLAKLTRIDELVDGGVRSVFAEHSDHFDARERRLIRSALAAIGADS